MFYKQLKVQIYEVSQRYNKFRVLLYLHIIEKKWQAALVSQALKISNIFDKSIEEIFPYDMIENA